MQVELKKLAKNEMRCFKCRTAVGKRVGDWHDWDNMQVFLCPICEKDTKESAERVRARI